MTTPRTRRTLCVAALVSALSLPLTGCGLKGALYLPSQKRTSVPAAAPAGPGTAAPRPPAANHSSSDPSSTPPSSRSRPQGPRR